MHEERTTAVIQRDLDALQRDSAAQPLVRSLLEHSVQRRLNQARLMLREQLADLLPGGGPVEAPPEVSRS